MPYERKTPRTVQKVIGEIDPNRLYTLRRVMECVGLGRVSLSEGVEAGYIRKHYTGHHVYIRGADVIEWILAHDARGNLKPKKLTA